MAAPDFTGITTGLGKAQAAVGRARTNMPAEAATHLDEIETHLKEVEAKVNEAKTNNGGGNDDVA